MVYAYVRVSTQMQDTDSQLFQIETYCNTHNMHIDKVYSEKVSGVKQPEERKLGTLLRRCKEGDLVIVSELSRLGRTLYMIMEVLNLAQKKKFGIYACKEKFEHGDNLQSKVIAFAFGLAAEIERTLISERTKEALAMRKKQGVKLGRPWKPIEHEWSPLEPRRRYILECLRKGKTHYYICQKLGCHENTLKRFLGIVEMQRKRREWEKACRAMGQEPMIMGIVMDAVERPLLLSYAGACECVSNDSVKK